MNWSFSKARIYSRCARMWYYSEKVAHHSSKDPLRREAYLLKQLKSVYAWRGSLVDTVIEKLIVPAIVRKCLPSEDEAIAYAMQLAERQLLYGRAKAYRTSGVKKSQAGDAYCAFYELEYDGTVDEAIVHQAKEDVSLSLRNLLSSAFIKQIMEEASFVAAQRPLVCRFETMTMLRAQPSLVLWTDAGAQGSPSAEFERIGVSCTPDLLAFFPNEPPLIVDWKVHAFANTESRRQLEIYAFVLSKTPPHKDFPASIRSRLTNPTGFRLVEYQLLRNQQRTYAVSPEDVANVEDYVFDSSRQMNYLLRRMRNGGDVSQIPATRSPGVCHRCRFKKLCWREDEHIAH